LAQSEEQVQRALSDLFLLHGKRWRRRGQTGVLVMPRRQQFHRAVCLKFLKARPVAPVDAALRRTACLCAALYFFGGRYSFFIGGFEPELMRWSVGTCLFARVFEHAIGEGAHEFDFLRGEEEYKYRFGAVNRDYKTLSTFSDSARGRMLRRRLEAEAGFMRRLHEKFPPRIGTPAAKKNPR
jgi:CelD/BcsL family acetyltransferase involved in cellulose biosynthesis